MISAVLVAIAGFARVADSGSVPRFERGPCIPAAAPSERVDCGMLVVREDRAKPNSPLIRVAVKIFKSRSPNPEPDPVVFMIGGPGGTTLNRTARDVLYADKRDYIVFDQRGTRNSSPVLECREINDAKDRIKRRTMQPAAADSAWINAAKGCAAKLRRQGIDPAMYHTRAVAADLEDLRRVLGIPRWNLYGVSYSARVMLTMLRDYPGSIRSVVLDSPLSLESRYDESATASMLRVLNLAMDACLVQSECAGRHPDLRSNFARAIERYRSSPQWVVVQPDSTRSDSLRVDAQALAEALVSVTANPRSLTALPTVIDRAANGDIRALAGVFAEQITPGDYVMGQRTSVWCNEVMPFEDRGRIAKQRDPAMGLGGADFSAIPPAACDAFGLPAPPPTEGVAVKSDVPTLILSGELDPYVPTPWARAMLPNLVNSFLVVVPAATHGPGYGECGMALINQFFDDPMKAPSHVCISKAQGMILNR